MAQSEKPTGHVGDEVRSEHRALGEIAGEHTTTEAEVTTLGELGKKYGIKPARFVALFNRGEFTSKLFKVGRSFKDWQVTPEEVKEWRRRMERKPGHFDKRDASDYRAGPSNASACPRRNSR